MLLIEKPNFSLASDRRLVKASEVATAKSAEEIIAAAEAEAARIRNKVQETVLAHEWALQMHGFYADTEKKTMRFAVVISFDIERKEALEILCAEVQALFPDYTLQIVMDVDISD